MDHHLGSQPDYPDEVVTRLITDALTPYVFRADTQAGLQAQLPTSLNP
jgi:hypothetical protein